MSPSALRSGKPDPLIGRRLAGLRLESLLGRGGMGAVYLARGEAGDQPKVVNGASDLMGEVFGDDLGPHARFAVGAASLPLGVAVEVDGVFELG